MSGLLSIYTLAGDSTSNLATCSFCASSVPTTRFSTFVVANLRALTLLTNKMSSSA